MFRFKLVLIFPSGHRGEPGKQQYPKADTSISLKTQPAMRHSNRPAALADPEAERKTAESERAEQIKSRVKAKQ